jgi:hypothetical protein
MLSRIPRVAHRARALFQRATLPERIYELTQIVESAAESAKVIKSSCSLKTISHYLCSLPSTGKGLTCQTDGSVKEEVSVPWRIAADVPQGRTALLALASRLSATLECRSATTQLATASAPEFASLVRVCKLSLTTFPTHLNALSTSIAQLTAEAAAAGITGDSICPPSGILAGPRASVIDFLHSARSAHAAAVEAVDDMMQLFREAVAVLHPPLGSSLAGQEWLRTGLHFDANCKSLPSSFIVATTVSEATCASEHSLETKPSEMPTSVTIDSVVSGLLGLVISVRKAYAASPSMFDVGLVATSGGGSRVVHAGGGASGFLGSTTTGGVRRHPVVVTSTSLARFR